MKPPPAFYNGKLLEREVGDRLPLGTLICLGSDNWYRVILIASETRMTVPVLLDDVPKELRVQALLLT